MVAISSTKEANAKLHVLTEENVKTVQKREQRVTR